MVDNDPPQQQQRQADVEDDDLFPLTDLDPAVAALLRPGNNDTTDDSGSSISELRLQVALMKLQQARVRGHSDYAATIMDHAIEQGAKDRQAWTLLDRRIQDVELHIRGRNSTADSSQSAGTTASNNNDNTIGNINQDGTEALQQVPQGADSTPAVCDERVQQLENQTKSLQQLLEQRLLEELESIQREQTSLHEQEERLSARIRSVRLAVNDPLLLESSSTASQKLKEALQNVTETHTSTLLHAECTVCHQHKATRAVIPCGHLALCKDCCTTLTKLETAAAKACPICRGTLLSTLPIYTTK